MSEKNDNRKTGKGKRILAMIGVVLVIAIYIIGLIFAVSGKGYAIMGVMTCMLLATYVAVYFHLGQVLINLAKKKNEREEEQSTEEDNSNRE